MNNLILNSPIGNIQAYINWANTVPMLSKEREEELARHLQETGDVDAAREMVMAHLRYVIKVARGYLGYGLPIADLIQEGNIGLMKAVKRFDPNVGTRLVTFASHWVKAEIHEFVLKNWRIVKVATTKAQRKLFFNLRKANDTLKRLSLQQITKLSKDLNVKTSDVTTMEMRLYSRDESFDAPTDEPSEITAYYPSHYLTSQSVDPALLIERQQMSSLQLKKLGKFLTHLDERSQDIIQSRWLTDKKLTLHQLANKYKVSPERIRQIEKAALNTLKSAITG